MVVSWLCRGVVVVVVAAVLLLLVIVLGGGGVFVFFTDPFLSFRPLLSGCQVHSARRVACM